MAKSWRNTSEYRHWHKAVLDRDNRTCQICGSKKHLVAHHICDASHFPDKRFDVNNGVTLCRLCHMNYHNNYLRSYRAKSDNDRWDNFLQLTDYYKSIFKNKQNISKK